MTITLLRWSLALVLGLGAVDLLISLAHAGHPGLPSWAAAALGAAELGAALGLMVPRAIRPAGFALFGVLAVAAGSHVALGAAPPAGYLVYGAAIWVVVHDRAERRGSPAMPPCGSERTA